MNQPFCTVPFVRAFVLPDGRYRECCATEPQIESTHRNFDLWWNQDQRLQQFRNAMQTGVWHSACDHCRLQEVNGTSFRTAVNQANPTVNARHPREWSIMFGNTCNLSCWTCSEKFSSTIESHKRTLKLLDADWINPNQMFEEAWPALRQQIKRSYDHHDEVTINVLGGEPTYNATVVEFIEWLLVQGLASRTRLEITTNGTKNHRVMNHLNSQQWRYIYVAVSVDAVGDRAEWIRYGSRWSDVDTSIDYYAKHANYVELHTTVSVLNLQDLPEVARYAQNKNLKLVTIPLLQPSYMSLMSWDGGKFDIDHLDYKKYNLDHYIDLIGSKPVMGAAQRLKEYLERFQPIRGPIPIDQKVKLV